MNAKASERPAALRRGRAIGIGAYSIFMTGVAGLWGIQVMRQVWFPETERAPACQAGVETLRRGLAEASRRAREEREEGPSIAAFRAHITPLWPLRHGLETTCAASEEALAALAALDQRRYREEAALRVSGGSDARQEDAWNQLHP